MVNQNNTIYALSSGQGKAGIAVIRISGSEVKKILLAITRKKNLPNIQHTTLSKIYDPFTNLLIDQGLVIFFKGPTSFTGEDVVELHLHGGYNIIKSTLKMLSQFNNTSLAEPGEFSKRAFYNNKFDLTGIEAILDLIDAETEMQRLQALNQLNGNLNQICFEWRTNLIKALSLQEALIDFSFDDIPGNTDKIINDLVKQTHKEIKKCLNIHAGEQIHNGLSAIILGKPNVGKSSLMNKLTNTDSAIVSPIEGTTRDTIEVRMDLKGIPINIIDTAGLRNTDNIIEQIGIQRAKNKAINADIKIMVISPDNLIIDDVNFVDKKNTILVINKIDLNKNINIQDILSMNNLSDILCVKTNALNGNGIDELLNAIYRLSQDILNVEYHPLITRERHRQSLTKVQYHLRKFLYNKKLMPEIITEELRLAVYNLGKITGKVDVEDLLDTIFKSFCIGK